MSDQINAIQNDLTERLRKNTISKTDKESKYFQLNSLRKEKEAKTERKKRLKLNLLIKNKKVRQLLLIR